MPDPSEQHETDEQREARADALRETAHLDVPTLVPPHIIKAARYVLRDWLGSRVDRAEADKRMGWIAGLAGTSLDDLLYEVGVAIECEAKAVAELRPSNSVDSCSGRS